ncbi:hypothetical protein CEXT_34601 [Caerostris extrusa]|uniref:Uncharacterized protein n=1 Tax=Caerostris extrusa TaxID=172846 RepID=A0AAV4XFL5_CAEEX|nr:hypothetical protein CEXT_34601 [Caerostris extrusa]
MANNSVKVQDIMLICAGSIGLPPMLPVHLNMMSYEQVLLSGEGRNQMVHKKHVFIIAIRHSFLKRKSKHGTSAPEYPFRSVVPRAVNLSSTIELSG